MKVHDPHHPWYRSEARTEETAPPLEIEVSVEMAAFTQAMHGVREFMERNDAAIREAFASLSRQLQSRS